MSKRTDMLGSVIREAIAPVLREAPPECGIVSISSLKLSPDGSYVDMFVSAFKEEKVALAYLDSMIPELKKKLSHLQLRIMPKIRFHLDKGQKEGNRVEELLRELEKKDSK